MSGSIASLEEWFFENEELFIVPYIEKRFNTPYARQAEYDFMRQHLWFTKKIILDAKQSNEQKLLKLLNLLSFGKSKIVTVVGGRGSGKTAAVFVLNELLYEEGRHRRIYYIKKGDRPEWLPEWIHHVQEMEDVPNNSLAILDESVLEYGSRNFYSDENKAFTERLVILRHKDVSIILITQHTKLIDINIRRLSDIFIYKMGSNVEDEGEYDKERGLLLKRLMPRDNRTMLVEIKLKGIFWTIETGLPTFWDDELVSKTFRDFNPEKKKRLERTKKYRQELDQLKEKEKIRADRFALREAAKEEIKTQKANPESLLER